VPNYFNSRNSRSPLKSGVFQKSDGLNLMPPAKNPNIPASLNHPLKPNMGFGPSRPVDRFDNTSGVIQNMIQQPPMPAMNSKPSQLGYVHAPDGQNMQFKGFADQRRNMECVSQDPQTNNLRLRNPKEIQESIPVRQYYHTPPKAS
jgi:hypothetical protein